MDSKRSRGFKSSVMVIDGDDLLLEILFRLPVKHLVRFKSVSKRWLSLISSPRFYRQLARRNSGFLMTGSCYRLPCASKIHFISLNGNPSMAPPPPFKSVVTGEGTMSILQSCKGLLLCIKTHKNQTENYCILNPTTMQYFMLPPLTDIAGSCTHRSRNSVINLAFDPLKSPYYKVVSVRSNYRFGSLVRYQIDIYSNENGIWRSSRDQYTVHNLMFLEDGVFSNGLIHWLDPIVMYWIYFNVDEERLVIRPPLQLRVPTSKRRYFGESFGHLHLLEIDYSETTFKVYELEKDNSNWFLKFNVDLDPMVNALANFHFKVLSIVREEDDDDECSLLLHIPGKIISYKFKDKSFRKLHDVPPCSCNDGGVGLTQQRCLDLYQYIETIACVCSCRDESRNLS